MRSMISAAAFAALLTLGISPAFAQPGTEGPGTEKPDEKPQRPERPERPDRPQTDNLMEHLDPNGDGQVSREEAHRFAREMHRRMRERMQSDRPQRPDGERPQRPEGDRPQTDRPQRPDRPDGERPQRPERPDAERPQRPDGDRPHADRPGQPIERIFNAADENEDGVLQGPEIRRFAQMLREFMARMHRQHDGQRPQGGGEQRQ